MCLVRFVVFFFLNIVWAREMYVVGWVLQCNFKVKRALRTKMPLLCVFFSLLVLYNAQWIMQRTDFIGFRKMKMYSSVYYLGWRPFRLVRNILNSVHIMFFFLFFFFPLSTGGFNCSRCRPFGQWCAFRTNCFLRTKRFFVSTKNVSVFHSAIVVYVVFFLFYFSCFHAASWWTVMSVS